MSTSIGKLSKSFFVKVLVGIIILPFIFWGMGDVFRGGNQNVIATIDSKKINTQEFVNYLNRLNLNDQQIKNLKSSDLLEKILSEFIGKKVMSLEIEKFGIIINDNSLRNIIINDELFIKDGKFSRTEYEKFLIKSNITAPAFEKNISEQESRRQFLSFIAGGSSIPDILVENEFKKENQSKTIKYIDLKNYYLKYKPSTNEINSVYNKNKEMFFEEFKSIQYTEITPKTLSESSEFDETFFKQLDILENRILDGQSFEEAVKENNFEIINIENINKNKKDKNNKEINVLNDKLFKKLYAIRYEKQPELIKTDNKYYLAEIKSVEKNYKSLNDPSVLEIINAQLNFKYKIESNTSIIKDLSMGGFDKIKMDSFAEKNNLEIKDYKISNFKQNEIFSEGIIKRIYLTKNGDIDLITNSNLTQNFLVLVVETKYKDFDKSSNDFEKYEAKARLNLINRIYKTYDENLNQKYKVQLNRKTIDRVKNSF